MGQFPEDEFPNPEKPHTWMNRHHRILSSISPFECSVSRIRNLRSQPQRVVAGPNMLRFLQCLPERAHYD